jgi:hypothetical protein
MIGHNHLGKNGRFGNQMFQYAATRGIAANRGFDWCIPPGPKTYDEFNDEENQHKLFMSFNLPHVKEVNLFPAPYVEEETFRFNENLFNNCEDNVNLYGYFQSPKYFNHIADEIREDFTFVDDILKPCKEMFSFGVDAISLHIRRTDHLIKPQYHPVLPLEYYEAALEKLPENLPVMIFSDDPKWCKAQSLFESDRFLISESDDNIIDMCLMTLCSHHIVANSTYSWWGAWLGNSKKVIAPKIWFGPAATIDEVDLVPEEWERI